MQTEVEIMNPYASYLMFTFLYIWLLAVGLLGLVICKYPAATREVMYLAILSLFINVTLTSSSSARVIPLPTPVYGSKYMALLKGTF